jgi:hypothetical protein
MATLGLIASIASTVSSAIGSVAQYRAAKQAERSAKQMGEYNAQVDVNNMVAEQGDITYARRAEELKKAQVLQKAEIQRKALTSEISQKTAAQKLKAPTFGGTYSSVFAATEQEGYDRLAAFDFGVSQETAGLSSSIQDSDRQLAYAYNRGMANRDLTLRTAQLQANKYRSEANNVLWGGVGSFGRSAASTYTFASDQGFIK